MTACCVCTWRRIGNPNLAYFQRITGAQHVFQVAFDLPFVDTDLFSRTTPIRVPARTFLSKLL
jgi:hypothetical protein